MKSFEPKLSKCPACGEPVVLYYDGEVRAIGNRTHSTSVRSQCLGMLL